MAAVYPNLKLAIFKRGIHQNQLARMLGMNETLLSKIIRGNRIPSVSQRHLLASCLEADENWLFEQFETPLGMTSRDAGKPPQAIENDEP